ncbi:ATP-grasp domain-containing protein [Streptomyces sp. H39-C1]|uniref:ATP-grasp domain-containing protein n=1 Tax=Streptomyces sp. H39-C1 TaxID=3004355 RepID=UPI0022AEBBD1|nr:ATP-grasp domain-containing protein [Streptomyces sp. H39-C1]MCZ4098068.1 ATP-grasp domain-containing protein [Streptomyces sp. H39-C1]
MDPAVHVDAPGRPRRILVTGVGGAPGFDLARHLMTLGCQVIAVDASPLAAGLHLPLTARLTPSADDPAYATALLDLCRELRPDAIIPTVEAELLQLIRLRGALEDLGVRTWLPSRNVVDACADKAQFAAVMCEHSLATPRSFLPHQIRDIPDGRPLVVKPRRGQGAKGVHFCSTRRQAQILCELVDEPLVQEHVTGAEFTADCLVDRAGRASVILRHRLLVRNGLAMVAATFHDEEATALVEATLAAVGITGLCCAQGFIRDDTTGGARVVMTEVNARVAGAFPLSVVAGADLVGQTLNGLFDLPVDHSRLGYQPGVQLTKYVETLTTSERAPGAGPSPLHP